MLQDRVCIGFGAHKFFQPGEEMTLELWEEILACIRLRKYKHEALYLDRWVLRMRSYEGSNIQMLILCNSNMVMLSRVCGCSRIFVYTNGHSHIFAHVPDSLPPTLNLCKLLVELFF
jgi:hypothetical protein